MFGERESVCGEGECLGVGGVHGGCMRCYPCHRDQWGGLDWRLCLQAPPPKPLHPLRASGEMRQGAGLAVLPHFHHITQAWAHGACPGKQRRQSR